MFTFLVERKKERRRNKITNTIEEERKTKHRKGRAKLVALFADDFNRNGFQVTEILRRGRRDQGRP
jgi:hypothetical protein